jgi:hypothetical protein
MALIKLNRTKTGAAPKALADGELFIDQLNGRLYWLDATGVIRYVDLAAILDPKRMPAFTGDVKTSAGSTATTISDGVVTIAKMAVAAFATTAQFIANTANLILTTDKVWAAGAFTTIPYASTITLDMATTINSLVNLGGAITFANPTTAKTGQSGSIVVNCGAAAQTISMGNACKTTGAAAPSLAAGLNRIDYLVYNSTTIFYHIARDLR